MSTFPPHTDLVVGPGFKSHYLGEGKGNSPLGGVLPSDTEGRNVVEIDFSGLSTLKVGRFPAYDYFSDGSFYLLDSPGHCVGHLCALARTTTNPDTFVFLAGDAAHHGSEIRPSKYVPFPDSITPNPVDLTAQAPPFCPGAWFEELQTPRGRNPKGPLWQPAFGHDMEQVMESIERMQECDGNENVLVCLAHDGSLREEGVPVFPETLNGWKQLGLGSRLRWWWIGDIVRCLKGT
jgi:glyoxylase-like metal-dependent hydrolase (beta-lactamase superfamily II)